MNRQNLYISVARYLTRFGALFLTTCFCGHKSSIQGVLFKEKRFYTNFFCAPSHGVKVVPKSSTDESSADLRFRG